MTTQGGNTKLDIGTLFLSTQNNFRLKQWTHSNSSLDLNACGLVTAGHVT